MVLLFRLIGWFSGITRELDYNIATRSCPSEGAYDHLRKR